MQETLGLLTIVVLHRADQSLPSPHQIYIDTFPHSMEDKEAAGNQLFCTQ